MKRTKRDFLEDISTRYRQAGEEWPASARQIAGWAIQQGLWKPQRQSLVSQCAREIAGALRHEFYIDPQGRRVRTKHAYTEFRKLADGTWEQLYLWADMRDVTSAQASKAFAISRKMIVGDCRQLKVDVDSYNDNNKNGDYIQMLFDFTEDLAELEQPIEYPEPNLNFIPRIVPEVAVSTVHPK